MISELIEKFRDIDMFDSKKVFEISDTRASLVKFLVIALIVEGLICSLVGVFMSNAPISIMGGVNASIGTLAFIMRVWLK